MQAAEEPTTFHVRGGVEITPVCFVALQRSDAGTLGGGELGHSLGALRHGVLGQLAGQDEAHSSLDFARGHSGLLVVARQLGSLGGNLLENVGDERVEDGDGPRGDSSVRVDLQIDGERQSASKFPQMWL